MFSIFRYAFFILHRHMCDAGMQTIYTDRFLCLADQSRYQRALDVSSKAGVLRINVFSESQILEQECF